jgi:hypothetical protein
MSLACRYIAKGEAYDPKVGVWWNECQKLVMEKYEGKRKIFGDFWSIYVLCSILWNHDAEMTWKDSKSERTWAEADSVPFMNCGSFPQIFLGLAKLGIVLAIERWKTLFQPFSMSLKALPLCHWLIHLVSLQQERQIHTRDRKSHGVPFEIWRYFYISFSRRSQSHFPCLLCFSNAYIVSTISTDHGMVWKLKSHVSHLIRETNTPTSEFSFASEGGLSWAANPNTTAHETPHKTHNKNKFLPCNENVHGIFPPLHALQTLVYLPKNCQVWAGHFLGICNRGSHVSGTFRQWADTIGGLRDSNMRCHSELHIRFRIRNQIVSPFLPFHDLHLSLGSSEYCTDD